MGLIVVATDGSPSAGVALDEAIQLAREAGHRIATVTVWQALQGDFGLAYPSTAVLSELLDAEHDHAAATLADAHQRCAAADVEVETHLLTGDPATTICRFARDHDAQLIACGTHGYGTLMSLLTGSVSRDIIRNAGCPVLVTHVKPQGERKGRAQEQALDRTE